MNNNFLRTASRIATACVFTGLLAASATAQLPDPIAYYSFNDDVGSTTLAEGNLDGNATVFDATYRDTVGVPAYGPGVLRGAWRGQGGAEDNFLTPDLTDLNGMIDLSISVWINPAGTPGFDGVIIARNAETSGGATQNYGINQQALGIDARAEGLATDAESVLTPGVWTHVAFVHDSTFGEATIYINGQAATTTSAPSGINWITGGVWNIGDDPCCGGREWAGLMDDLAIWNTFLDASQIESIYNDGINGIALDGTVNLTAGDVDGDGDVDFNEVGGDGISDYDIILANYLQDVAGMGNTRQFGDLTNDGIVNIADFRNWKNAFQAAGGGSVNIPEPASAMLIGVAALGGIGLARRRRASILAMIALGVMSMASATAEAQNVIVSVDQDTGIVTAVNTPSGEDPLQPVDFDGYEFGSTNSLLDLAGWTRFSVTPPTPGTAWQIVGGATNPPTVNRFAEALVTANAVEFFPAEDAPGGGISFGAAFDRSAVPVAQLAAGFGVEVRDVTFGYIGPGDSNLVPAPVVYTGDTISNNLVLKIDRATGNATLENESPFDITIDSFTISSASDSLNTSWAGSPDLPGADWDTGASAGALFQISPLSDELLSMAVGGVVQGSGSIDLGDIFTVGGDEDVSLLFGQPTDPDLDPGFAAVVEFFGASATLDGDYNDDGVVDGIDYAVWRENLGMAVTLPNDTTPGVVTGEDFTVWQNNFGAGGAGAAQATPEPAGLSLLTVCLAGLISRRRR